MSELKVEIVEISKVEKHPNADRLDIAYIKDWTCVTQKDKYKKGDVALYIPIDSVLSEKLENYLFPPDSKIKLDKHRVKTIKIRGAISQGMILNLDELISNGFLPTNVGWRIGYDFAYALGITKYEPPVRMSPQSNVKQVKKRDKHPEFNEYTDINNFKWYPDLFKEDEHVVVLEKLHGCFPKFTKITMANGNKKAIGDIKIGEYVLGRRGNLIIPVKVTKTYRNGSTDRWVKITGKRKFSEGKGNNFFTIHCTDNHQLFDPSLGVYKNADEFQKGHDLYLLESYKELDSISYSVLLGKILGDGCLQDEYRSIGFGHKKKHEEYVDYTLKCLGSFAGNKQKYNSISEYGTLMVRGRSVSCYSIWENFRQFIDIKTNTKIIPEIIINKLNWLSLAFWYMDDGNLSHHESQQDRANFAVCGFDEKSVDNLVKALNNLGLDAVKSISSGYFRIRLNKDSADIMFKNIAKYIPPVMQYKLPEIYRGKFEQLAVISMIDTKHKLFESEVYSIKYCSLKEVGGYATKFDLETESHNYFAQGILVHNSNFRAGVLPYHASNWWKKVKKFLGLAPKYEFCYGSHRVQMQYKKTYKGYYDKNTYLEMVKKYDLENKLEPGEIVFGEVIGDGVQKNYLYGCKPNERKLVIFDVKKNGVYQNHLYVKRFCDRNKLDHAPIEYIGRYKDKEHLRQYVEGVSTYAPIQKIREGIVIKPFIEEHGYMGRKILKWKSDNFLLTQEDDTH
jgi:tRNA-binding EMAP/Myf-like protein